MNRRLTIGTRLGISFATLLGLTSALAIGGAVLLHQLAAMNRSLHDVGEQVPVIERWRGAVALNLGRALLIGKAGHVPALATFIDPQMKATSEQISTLQKQLEERLSQPDEKQALAEVAALRKSYVVIRNRVTEALQQGREAEVASVIDGEMGTAAAAYLGGIDKLEGVLVRRAQALDAEVQARSSQGLGLLLGLGGLVLLAGVGLAIAATRSLVGPLGAAAGAARRIADNDLRWPVTVDRHDELGALQGSLSAVQQRLSADVAQIRASTDSIATASAQIAAGSSDLSRRTEQTASSLQQTSSSVEELNGTVAHTAESARTASQLAHSASAVAARGGEVVTKVVATMDDISTSSRRIADIIGTIDGIAFQTNILALNAAVEAARAGEQGRGFAVVASEVRSLAQRSAEAAREIKSLIGTSVDRVEAGSRLVQEAGSTMGEIVQSVHRVNDIIGEISSATAEQSKGLGLVTGAVAELDRMTQQNAALVEQSAAAAESLKAQAGTLAGIVDTFKLATAGNVPADPTPTPSPRYTRPAALAPAAWQAPVETSATPGTDAPPPKADRPARRLEPAIADASPAAAPAPRAAEPSRPMASASNTAAHDEWESF